MLDWVQTLWEYNYWGHRKLWESVESINEQDFVRPVAYSMGSVHKQIVHIVWAEALWLARIQGTVRPEYTIDSLPTRAAIRAEWDGVEEDWRAYLSQLSENDMNKTFSYTRQNGESLTSVLSEILCHVVNHGTDHRAQVLRLVADYGGKTFEQDLFFYYRERDQRVPR